LRYNFDKFEFAGREGWDRPFAAQSGTARALMAEILDDGCSFNENGIGAYGTE
jgi:hypothetical protein